jgi:hypothetical protein
MNTNGLIIYKKHVMKFSKIFIGSLATMIFVSSCEKAEIPSKPLASINITNVVAIGKTARLNSYTTNISNNGFSQFGLHPGDNSLYVYPTADSLNPYYNQPLSVQEGEIYSLFLAGPPAKVDAVLIKENIPFITDSSFSVRFINLSPNSDAISINIVGKPDGSEVSNLAYKQISDFKSYQALSTNASYAFQVRQISTGKLLASYTFSNSSNPIPRFANVTLVIRGMVGGSPSIGVTRVNNDR